MQEGTNLEKLQPLAFIGPAFRLTSLQWMGVAWLIVTPTVLAHSYSFLSYLSVAGVAFSAALPFIGTAACDTKASHPSSHTLACV